MSDQAKADSREEMMAGLGKKHAERLAGDMTPIDMQEPPDDPDEEPEEQEPPKEDAAETVEDASTRKPEPEEEDPIQEVVIDGTREQHRRSVIDAAGGQEIFQKVRAANKRMEEATLARREALELKKRYEELAATQTKKEEPPAPPLPAAEIAKQMRTVERRIYLEATTQEDVDALLEEKDRLQESWYEAKQRERQAMDAAARQNYERAEHLKSVTAVLSEKHPGWETLQEDPAFDQWLKAPDNWMYREAWAKVPNAASVLRVVADFSATQKPVAGFDETRKKKEGIDVVQSASRKAAPPSDKKPPTDSQYVQGLRKMRAGLRGEATE